MPAMVAAVAPAVMMGPIIRAMELRPLEYMCIASQARGRRRARRAAHRAEMRERCKSQDYDCGKKSFRHHFRLDLQWTFWERTSIRCRRSWNARPRETAVHCAACLTSRLRKIQPAICPTGS